MVLFQRETNVMLIVAVTMLAGCLNFSMGWGDDDEGDYVPYDPPEYMTEILEIVIDPNPVAAGDSVTFRCIIKDSLDPAFYYYWYVVPNDTADVKSYENTYTVKASETPGEYWGHVIVTNDDTSKAAPNEEFWYEVTARE